MSLSSQLKDIACKPNDTKFALYESLASKVVASNKGPEVLELAKHCQTPHDNA
jgi:hypothetical protein